jgi:hypothetical protein
MQETVFDNVETTVAKRGRKLSHAKPSSVSLEVSPAFESRNLANRSKVVPTQPTISYLEACELLNLQPRAYQLFECEDLKQLKSVQSDFIEYAKKKGIEFNPFEDASTVFFKGFRFAGINVQTMKAEYNPEDLTFNGITLEKTPKGEEMTPVYYMDDRVCYVLGEEAEMRQNGKADFTQMHLLSFTPDIHVYNFLTKGY